MIITLVIVGTGVWYSLNPQPTSAERHESIVVGTTVQELAGLIYIAEDQGFFTLNGLNVTVRYYDTGLASVTGMTNGEVEIAVSSEYPVVGKVLNHENIVVIGGIDKYQGQYLVGRKDFGIEKVADLQGKKIGLPRGTITEFYLGRFLYLNDLSLQNITIVNIQPQQYGDFIGNGSVDAILVPQAYLETVADRLGSNAVIWPAQSNQDAYGVLTCRCDWIASHPETVNRFMESLARSEAYAVNHPAVAKAIVQKRLNYSNEDIENVWSGHKYSISLDLSLVTAMEDEGRWMIANNLTSEQTIPDYRTYIYTEGLEGVKPGSINLR